MNGIDNQLTRTQVLGIILLGICVWAILIGLIWALLKDMRDGVIITLAGVIGSGALIKWLKYVNQGRLR